jgi:hypothetical protein
MPQTAAGAIKCAAARIGISEAEYRELTARGQKWCGRCRSWHERSVFVADSSRYDGLSATCRESRNTKARQEYDPKPRPAPGRRYVRARDNDKKQARRRVDHLIAVGLLPEPDDLACCDCRHLGGDRRHEYDHYLGYAPEHHEHVQAVCSKCHRRRAVERGEWVKRKSNGRPATTGR